MITADIQLRNLKDDQAQDNPAPGWSLVCEHDRDLYELSGIASDGQPVSPYRLSERLHQIGIQPGPARSTALFQLATELPAAILARMLGIHIDVAVAWQRASAGDWMTYAADVSRRNAEDNRP